MPRTRSSVAWPSFSGLLKAKETAVFETPAAVATSAMVTRDTQVPSWLQGNFPHINRFSKAV